MSTEVHPAISPQISFSGPSPPQQRNYPFHKPPPASYDGQSPQRRRTRSASFSGLVSRILPSRKQEKGGTLREQFRDGGPLDAVDVVFGLAGEPGMDIEGGRLGMARGRSPRGDDRMKRRAYAAVGPGVSALTSGDSAQGKKRRCSLSWFFRPLITPEKSGGLGQEGQKSVSFQQPSKQIPFSPRVHETGTQPEKGKHTVVEDNARAKVHEIHSGKKSRKEQRRSLRESGDFLGVQGANPRTGYWDISDTTSSSDTAKMLRYLKKRGKARQIKLAAKMKDRRSKRWRPSETAWSSVVEPELSPIEQSSAGSPVKRNSSADRLLPMQTAANPKSHEQSSPVEVQDGPAQRTTSPPSGRGALHPAHQSVESTPHLHPNITIRRKPIGSPPRRPLSGNSEDTVICAPDASGIMDTAENRPRQHQNEAPAEVGDSNRRHATSQEGKHFLGKCEPLGVSDNPGERKAIAISFRSVIMKQVQIDRPPVIRRQISFQGKLVGSPSELPPVSPEAPLDVRIPLNFQAQKGCPQVWAPPTILNVEPDEQTSSTSIPTTTTTGCLPPAHHLSIQVDGPESDSRDMKKAPPPQRRRSCVRHSSLRRRPYRIPLRGSSLVSSKRNEMQNQGCPVPAVDIDISSEPHLDQVVRRRTARFCGMVSPGRGKVGKRSTRISISTSPPPRRRVKLKSSARSPMFLAFKRLKYPAEMTEVARKMGMHRQVKAVTVATEDGDDTVDPLVSMRTTREAEGEVEAEAEAEVEVGNNTFRTDDSLVVWHAEPGRSVGDGYASAGKSKDAVILHPAPATHGQGNGNDTGNGNNGNNNKNGVLLFPANNTRPRPARQPASAASPVSAASAVSGPIGQVAACWSWIVGPLLDPDRRLGPRPETEAETTALLALLLLKLQEIGLFVAAALLAAAIHVSVAIAISIIRVLRLLTRG
ncbi:uncharacterized protein BP5553_08034 [Venustampulla echinocandica]|uniref:Uncharacterized protein n=1 Tax=Venustampulla echinocandica TaxID=2656787 RepID=A0A370TFJ3_9HELO|nr:uncharacterized protein BP5553_08034 [Venustampulla echinocandica]RDL33666.1 hypothetical protein BP5553_08034 [Venustampulla echinocandica]